MSVSKNERTSERIPYHQKVKVVSVGRLVAYTMAINVGLGGVLLSASPALPIGSQCRITLPATGPGGAGRIEAEGTVVRQGADGTAVRFASALEASAFDGLVQEAVKGPFSLFTAYQNYFRVSRNQDLEGCERLLGVSKRAFRTTFYATFSSCITLAILPVWLLRASIPPYPNWVKIALCFVYGAIWLAVIQPSLDLAVFRFLRRRQAAGSGA